MFNFEEDGTCHFTIKTQGMDADGWIEHLARRKIHVTSDAEKIIREFLVPTTDLEYPCKLAVSKRESETLETLLESQGFVASTSLEAALLVLYELQSPWIFGVYGGIVMVHEPVGNDGEIMALFSQTRINRESERPYMEETARRLSTHKLLGPNRVGGWLVEGYRFAGVVK